MKKNITEKLLNWDAHYAGIKAMREAQQNCIILGELEREVMPQLSHFAHTTIEEAIPVFMEWAESGLKENMASQKMNYLSKQWS